MNQKDNRSELQQRLDAQLRAKAAERQKQDTERPDGVSDSAYIEGTKQTTSLAWAWGVIAILAVLTFLFFIYRANTA